MNTNIESFRADAYGNLKTDDGMSPQERRKKRLKDLGSKINNDQNLVGKFLISFFDMFLNGIIKIINEILYSSVKFGNNIFKKDDEALKTNIFKKGAIYDYIYLRYFITIITPPMGVFLSKGIHGWMNIILCIFFCYLNYIIGIVYALVITYNSHFPDLYTHAQKEKINEIKLELKEKEKIDMNQQKGELFVMFFFLFIFIGIFAAIIFLNKKIIKK
jgi:uncharacterized membrane protein YqaE (UPF0057 family)